MRTTVLSDLHGWYPKLPGGDLLILAGDYTSRGKVDEWAFFFKWLRHQEYTKKVLIGGNHDNFLQECFKSNEANEANEANDDFDYLCDSGIEYEGIKMWGAPWTKNFEGQNDLCKAFGLETNEEMKEKWYEIPDDTDILITHSPPQGILDQTWKNRVGCSELRKAVARVKPKYHFFGHIHESHGDETRDGIHYYNVSHVNDNYEPINKPVNIEL